ncbi:endonuclease/exonuclease/phosphatase family protein [Fibrella arboris]|uniref:endonuclease/exonuclease/phosphatase family protein n=1 Tax=Fibrella arboris TaxID=3242486 RepID=UPI0035216662
MSIIRTYINRRVSFLFFFWGVLIEAIQLFFRRYRQFPMAYSTLIYLFVTVAFCYSPTIGHWATGFIMMSLPLAIPSGIAACIYLLYRQQHTIAMAGLVWVLFSFLLVKRVVGTSSGTADRPQAQALTVLSFNSETFPAGTSASTALSLKADIACFQEYSPNAQLDRQYAAKIEKLTCFGDDRQVGLALFSRFPILKQYGHLWERAQGPDINGFLCADIAYGADTIRVVNVHLWSMGVRTSKAIDALATGDLRRFFVELGDTFQRLKEGFQHRNTQLQEVESYVAGSRYPVIICGDFNETPMGYSYGKLSQNFRNAFEEAGHGLGFTLNRHPYCVRIDQQFVSQDWQIRACQTLSGVSFSDHFPVLAEYVLKKSINAPAVVLAQH